MTEKNRRGAAPGENRFRKSQDSQIKLTKDEVGVVLELLRVRRVTFRNITHLASYVADVITEKRGVNSRKMAHSTLLRTRIYRVKLDGYFASMGGKKHAENFTKLITELELKELDDLRAENKRLAQFIEKNLSREPEPSRPKPSIASMQDVNQLYRAISLILEASEGQIVIDQESGEIVNGWAKSKKNRVVVPASISKPYIQWQNSFPIVGIKRDGE